MFPWEQAELCRPAGPPKAPSHVYFTHLQSPREEILGSGSSPASAPTWGCQSSWKGVTEHKLSQQVTIQKHFSLADEPYPSLEPQSHLHKAPYTPHNGTLSSTALPSLFLQLLQQSFSPRESLCRVTSLCHLTQLWNPPEIKVCYPSQENTFFSSAQPRKPRNLMF